MCFGLTKDNIRNDRGSACNTAHDSGSRIIAAAFDTKNG
jgi:hypothetical protein